MAVFFEEIKIGSTFDAKGFKQADTAAAKLSKTTKTLAKSLGLAFGARAVLLYGKSAVEAFAADDKAAKTLSRTLKNLGLQYADPQAKSFIADLERQYGVLDDLLRPAFQKLITTTGDFATSQKLLKTSLDLAAMSGVDVVTVATDLSKAYSGNTKGLQKYGLGIDKAALATMSFDEILTQISKISSGQAEEAANSYAGSLDRLNVAAKNASESIGKDLVTALTTLGGTGGLPKTLGLIESFASAIGDAIIGISRLARAADIITSSTNPIQMFKRLAAFQAEYRAADAKEAKDAEIAARRYGGIYADIYNNQKKLLKTKKSLTAEELKALAASKLKAAIDKANAALGKGSDVFDLDKIQIAAALTNQAEALGQAVKDGNAAGILQVANDTARLNVKRDILALEDAIASKDTAAIVAATAKLNEDLKILNALNNQKTQMVAIESILNGLKPKDLIDQNNLDEALRKIKEMLALLGQIKSPSSSSPTYQPPSATNPFIQTPNGISPISPARSLEEVNAAVADLGGVVSVIGENGKEFIKLVDGAAQSFQSLEDSAAKNMFIGNGILTQPFNAGSFRSAEGGSLFNSGATGAYDRGTVVVNVTVQGSVLSEQDLTQVVQNAVQANNRYGNNLNVAGAI